MKNHPFIYEPTTTITDFIIFLLGCYYGWYTILISGSSFHLIWGGTFFLLSISALLGAISHGFGPKFSKLEKKVVWFLTLFFVGLTSLGLLTSVFLLFTNGSFNVLVLFVLIISFALYIYRILREDSFSVAVRFYFPILIITFFGFVYIFLKKGYTGSLFISIGIIVTLVASLIQRSRITLHEYFNYNDFFHVLQMIGMYFLYEGGLEIPKI